MMDTPRRNPGPEELTDDALISLGREAFVQEASALESIGGHGVGLAEDLVTAFTRQLHVSGDWHARVTIERSDVRAFMACKRLKPSPVRDDW